MILLSGAFSGDINRFDNTPTAVGSIRKIQVGNGVFDELFVSRSVSMPYNESSKKWDFDTVMYALFKGTLFAGNVEYTAETVDALRIKRRRKNSQSLQWETLFEIPILKNEDFNFVKYDKFARGSTEYYYTLVPVANGVEGDANSYGEIKSDFECFYLIDKDTVYQAYLNLQLSTQRNQNSTSITTMGRKYPFNISSAYGNYTSGQLQATFINKDLSGRYDVENGWRFREEVDDFLTNGKVKILKNDEGKMWMIAVVDAIPQDMSQHWQMPIHSISWVEVGDCESFEDLYDNGLIDVDTRLIR